MRRCRRSAPSAAAVPRDGAAPPRRRTSSPKLCIGTTRALTSAASSSDSTDKPHLARPDEQRLARHLDDVQRPPRLERHARDHIEQVRAPRAAQWRATSEHAHRDERRDTDGRQHDQRRDEQVAVARRRCTVHTGVVAGGSDRLPAQGQPVVVAISAEPRGLIVWMLSEVLSSTTPVIIRQPVGAVAEPSAEPRP